ncbi:MAG: MBOAT family protein [Elusimicrobia bacterium]|nr:MBOAT family protein [Elusimicrobiota bacterium]
MVFSSLSFLFIFLPLCLISYFLVPKQKVTLRKYILLFFSLIFYAAGEPLYIFVMIATVAITFSFSCKVEKHSKTALALSICFVLLPLIIFKYLNFIIDNLNILFGFNFKAIQLTMPIGISFYTFQILTYIIDLYRGNVNRQKNVGYLALYIFLFPQLIAGPIVRYADIETSLSACKESKDKILEGARRFIIGLAKKVLIANQVGFIVSEIGGMPFSQVGTSMMWLSSIAFTIQLYFDFSGYSDMAIGLGKIFGFNFKENFNLPYISVSISDFWKRWHISMSTFFRDYVYIPMGGSRCHFGRWIFNVLIVWMITGLWHGAKWNFVLWGLYYALLLMIEKFIVHIFNLKLKNIITTKFTNIIRPFTYLLTFILTVIGWTLFMHDTNNFMEMIHYLQRLFSQTEVINPISIRALDLQSYIPCLLIGIILSSPLILIFKKIKAYTYPNWIIITGKIINDIFLITVFILSIIFIVGQNYNPFIYFRF